MTGNKPDTLAAALCAAQQAAEAVSKDATNTFHRYEYASAEAILTEARAALNIAGLSVSATKTLLERQGDTWMMHAFYRVLHVSGESAELESSYPVIPDKGRPLDKAMSAARTTALAYALRDLLLLPRVAKGDEVDHRDDTQYDPTRPGPTSPSGPAPRPLADRAVTSASSPPQEDRVPFMPRSWKGEPVAKGTLLSSCSTEFLACLGETLAVAANQAGSPYASRNADLARLCAEWGAHKGAARPAQMGLGQVDDDIPF